MLDLLVVLYANRKQNREVAMNIKVFTYNQWRKLNLGYWSQNLTACSRIRIHHFEVLNSSLSNSWTLLEQLEPSSSNCWTYCYDFTSHTAVLNPDKGCWVESTQRWLLSQVGRFMLLKKWIKDELDLRFFVKETTNTPMEIKITLRFAFLQLMNGTVE